MKTSSKIAIAAAAVGAWLIAKKNKSVSGIGRVEYSNFGGAQIISKNGNRAIEISIINNAKGDTLGVYSLYKSYGRFGSYWEYLSTIGEYKTLSGAIKAAKKYWDESGVEYNPKDFEKL